MIHPSQVEILRFFEYDHLPEPQQRISKTFYDLAHSAVEEFDGNNQNGAEVTVGLRKLLEAKDCFVRASLPRREG